MTKLRWTTQAVEDVEAIRKFIANDSEAYADLVVARLLESVERLQRFPRSGRMCLSSLIRAFAKSSNLPTGSYTESSMAP